MIITKEELARKLDGCEVGSEISQVDERDAKESGLVVVFGYSDDNVEFRGAIHDEIGCYEGTTVLLHKGGALDSDHECDCTYCAFKSIKGKCIELRAAWCAEPEYSWTYDIGIPHSSFDVMEGDKKFCRGIIVETAMLPSVQVG